jgi:hypothetical protein
MERYIVMIKFLKKHKTKIFKTMLSILFCYGLLVLIFICISSSPIKMPKYTLSNGKQEIVFQTMIHIAKPQFYNRTIRDVRKQKLRDYRYLYELVKFTEEGHLERFKEYSSVDPSFQLLISDALGLTHQKDFLEHLEEEDTNADIDSTELLRLIESDDKFKFSPVLNSESIKEFKLKLLSLSTETDFNKNIFERTMKFSFHLIMNFPSIVKSKSPIFDDIILDSRNKKLLSYIVADKKSNFIINYGYMHFDGFFEELKKVDPKWKIVSEDYLIAF